MIEFSIHSSLIEIKRSFESAFSLDYKQLPEQGRLTKSAWAKRLLDRVRMNESSGAEIVVPLLGILPADPETYREIRQVFWSLPAHFVNYAIALAGESEDELLVQQLLRLLSPYRHRSYVFPSCRDKLEEFVFSAPEELSWLAFEALCASETGSLISSLLKHAMNQVLSGKVSFEVLSKLWVNSQPQLFSPLISTVEEDLDAASWAVTIAEEYGEARVVPEEAVRGAVRLSKRWPVDKDLLVEIVRVVGHGALKDGPCIEFLFDCLKSEFEAVQTATLYAFGRLKIQAARLSLMPFLKSARSEQVTQTIIALGRMEAYDADTIEHVRALTLSEDPGIKDWAEAFVRKDVKALLNPKRGPQNDWQTSLRRLAQSWGEGVDES